MTYHRHLPAVNDRSGLIVMTSIFSALSLVAVGLRFYARKLSKIPCLMDDWLSLASLVFVLALNSIFMAGIVQGAITGHSVVVDNWPVTSRLEHLAEKYKYAFQTTEKLAFGLIKLSILFLWKRVFDPVKSFRIFCWVMIGVVIAWSLSFFFGTVFQCGTEWWLNWAPIGDFLTECSNTLNMLTVFAASDVITDIIIIMMPMRLIWQLKMSKERKLGVLAILLIGVFTVGGGIARMYLYLGTSYDIEDNPDFIADFTNFILWSEIEINVAMLCSCMPTLVPVLIKAKTVTSAGSFTSLISRKPWRRAKSSRSSVTDDRSLNNTHKLETQLSHYKVQVNGSTHLITGTSSDDSV